MGVFGNEGASRLERGKEIAGAACVMAFSSPSAEHQILQIREEEVVEMRSLKVLIAESDPLLQKLYSDIIINDSAFTLLKCVSTGPQMFEAMRCVDGGP